MSPHIHLALKMLTGLWKKCRVQTYIRATAQPESEVIHTFPAWIKPKELLKGHPGDPAVLGWEIQCRG